jgi:hypothetical protein
MEEYIEHKTGTSFFYNFCFKPFFAFKNIQRFKLEKFTAKYTRFLVKKKGKNILVTNRSWRSMGLWNKAPIFSIQSAHR